MLHDVWTTKMMHIPYTQRVINILLILTQVVSNGVWLQLKHAAS